jgi:hypothetical protein
MQVAIILNGLANALIDVAIASGLTRGEFIEWCDELFKSRGR